MKIAGTIKNEETQRGSAQDPPSPSQDSTPMENHTLDTDTTPYMHLTDVNTINTIRTSEATSTRTQTQDSTQYLSQEQIDQIFSPKPQPEKKHKSNLSFYITGIAVGLIAGVVGFVLGFGISTVFLGDKTPEKPPIQADSLYIPPSNNVSYE